MANGRMQVTDPPGYIESRKVKAHLRYRYRARSLAAFSHFMEYGNGSRMPVVVDFGAAEGETLLELARLFKLQGTFTGLEISKDYVMKAPDLPENVRLLVCDITEPHCTVEEGSADMVTAMAVLEHLEKPEAAVGEAYRMLKKGGIFIATCPDPQWERIASCLGLLRDDSHYCCLDRKRLCGTIESSGLSVVLYRLFMWAPLAVLPYFGISLSPQFAMKVDDAVSGARALNLLFVNQLVVATKQ